MAAIDKYRIICAIDFGTARTGYAYIHLSDPSNVLVNPVWPHSPGGYEKTATELLISRGPEYKLREFGFSARRRMSELSQEEASCYLFISGFKMNLDPSKARSLMVKASNCDDCLPLLRVISLSLEFVMKNALEQFKKQGSNVSAERVLWVITVPAIWDTAAKQMMAEAAAQAGLGKDNVLIALEPEAASLICMRASSLPAELRRPGTRYMVIDTGGGTVDITVHEIQTDLTIHELLPPSGGPWGSMNINDSILKIYENIFSREAVAQAKKFPEWIDLLDKIETIKTSCTTSDHSSLKNLDIGPLFNTSFGPRIQEMVDKFNSRVSPSERVQLRGSTLRVPAKHIHDIIDPLVQKIIDHVKGLLAKQDVSLIFFVGGFAESEILQKKITAAFQTSKRIVVIPPRPGLAVLTGAALFGLNPGIITSRSAPFTYGIEKLELWDARKHSGREVVNVGPTQYCPGVFDIFIRAGQPVDLVSEIRRTYVPVTPSQAEVEIPVYRSVDQNPSYTDDTGVKYVGSLTLKIPGVGNPPEERQVEVAMKFGDTNVSVTATFKSTGAKTEATYKEYISDEELPHRPSQPSVINSIDLCIAMDCTGSMGSWIAKTKQEALNIAASIIDRFPSLSFHCSFVGYRDIGDKTRYLISGFSNGCKAMQDFLGNVTADGGADGPEDILGALCQVAAQEWSGTVRILVHIADAPCHGRMFHDMADDYPDGDPQGLTPEYVLKKLVDLKIDYYFLRLCTTTEKMERIFSDIYRTLSGKGITTVNIGQNVAALLPSVVDCVIKSVTSLNQKR